MATVGESISVDMWAIPGIWIKLQIRRQGLSGLAEGERWDFGAVKCISKNDIFPRVSGLGLGLGLEKRSMLKEGKSP